MRILVLAALLAAPAAAQEVVGSGVVAGRAVELLSDGTWRERPPTAEGCTPVVGPLAFCSGPPEFTPTDDLEPGSPIDAQWRAGSARFAQVLHDATGEADGVTLDGIEAAVIDNAARFAGVAPQEVEVVATIPALVDEALGRTVVYVVALEGTPFVFQNTLLLLPDDHAQIMTFATGRGPDAELASLHQRFLDAFRIEDAAR